MASTQIGTVSEGFQGLLSRIELDPTRAQLASQHYSAVKKLIETALLGKTVSQIGSFQRKTKIRPIDDSHPLDVDLIACFGPANRIVDDGSGVTPAGALEAVRRALVSDRTYRLMNPESDAPTVVLEYADGIKIEITPCYTDFTGKRPRLGGPACYLVGTSDGNWIPADYDYDAARISGTNQLPTVAQALVPSIKMIKQFLRGKDLGLKSFHVEVLCALIIPGVIADWTKRNLAWDYHHVLSHFLSDAHQHLNGPVAIPGSYSPAVDSGWSSQNLQKIGQILHQYGQLAWEICKEKDDARALDRWRDFYGDPFPA